MGMSNGRSGPATFGDVLDATRAIRDWTRKGLKEYEDDTSGHLRVLERKLLDLSDKVELLLASLDEREKRIEASNQALIGHVKSLVTAQAAPVVHLSVPEGAFKIDLPAPIVKNILPKQEQVAPVVNVNVPEGAIKTIVEMPRRTTKVEKSIIYSQVTGRPEKVVEEMTEQ